MAITRLRTRDPWWDFKRTLKRLESFNTYGSLKGRKSNRVESYGQMRPYGDRRLLQSHEKLGLLEYVVYSYATPIAWRADGEWYTSEYKYSVTTGRHQSRIFTAISQLDGVLNAGAELNRRLLELERNEHKARTEDVNREFVAIPIVPRDSSPYVREDRMPRRIANPVYRADEPLGWLHVDQKES